MTPKNPDLLRQVVNGPFRSLTELYREALTEPVPRAIKDLLDRLK